MCYLGLRLEEESKGLWVAFRCQNSKLDFINIEKSNCCNTILLIVVVEVGIGIGT